MTRKMHKRMILISPILIIFSVLILGYFTNSEYFDAQHKWKEYFSKVLGILIITGILLFINGTLMLLYGYFIYYSQLDLNF